MRRSERTTDRYDYKVLSTIGTTEQDEHPLYKSNSGDITNQVIQSDGITAQINVEPSLNTEDNNGHTASHTEHTASHTEQVTTITKVHHSNGSSNLSSDQQHQQHQQHINTHSDVNHTGDEPSSSNDRRNIVSEAMDAEKLTVDEATVSEDIDDFFEENDVREVGDDPVEFDKLTRRAEDFRTSYRSVHKQLLTVMGTESYQEKYKEVYNVKLDSIKKYVKDLKHHKKKLQETSQSAKVSSDKAKYDFLLKEFDSTFKELIKYFITDDSDWEGLSDEDLTRRRSCLEGKEKVIHTLSVTVREVVGMAPDDESRKSITQNYESLRTAKTEYTKLLDEVVKKRQLDQKKTFNRSKLNIELPKFKGYSGMDIYTFKSKFEKLHPASEVPKEHLPELLINNFLSNPALLLVKDATDIESIWARLTEAYGDCKRLLANKVAELGEVEGSCKSKDPEKVVEGLSKVINLMGDLMKLATDHNLKQKLYHGDTMEKIHSLMGEGRFTRWLSISCDKDLNDEGEKWTELKKFLEKEIKINQQKVLLSLKKKKDSPQRDQGSRRDPSHHSSGQGTSQDREDSSYHTEGNNNNNNICKICSATDHIQTSGPNGSKLIQYFVCKKFVDMTPAQRCLELKSKNLCFQCLFPGADKRQGKHKDGRCQRDFICPHPSHSRFTGKKHVLVCEEHKADEANKQVLDEYKRRCIARPNQVELPPFTQAILIHHNSITTQIQPGELRTEEEQGDTLSVEAPEFFPIQPEIDGTIHIMGSEESSPASLTPSAESIPPSLPSIASKSPATLTPLPDVLERNVLPDVDEEAIYILQMIEVDGNKYSLFFDGGCKKFVSRYSAIERLGSRATLLRKGPIGISGVGGMTMTTPHGIYRIELPVRGGYQATMSGTCMDTITEKFPMYPLDGKVEQDITAAYIKAGGEGKLPSLEPLVGGDSDFMFGGAYMRYFPKELFRMPSGLTIFESVFQNASGGYGVVGGNHSVFTEIEKWYHINNQGLNFIQSQLKIYHGGYQINPDVRMLGFRETYSDEFNCYDEGPVDNSSDQVFKTSIQVKLKRFQASQFAGSEIQYRCPKCRNCQPCKNCDEDMTIKEEIEQEMIEESVVIDTENRCVIASLPLIADPSIKLCPNKGIARKIYDQQLRKLNKNPADKESILKSEGKLQTLGYVDYVKNLPEETQEMLETSPIQNFIPWLVVWKEDSMTTPCRMVSHASMPTASGYSLNDCLAKGRNNLNKLLEIWIRWRTHPFAYHNDINKMYNNVTLIPEHWCLQRYFFEPNLDPTIEPLVKVMKTAFYGVKSSGNQAECALRKIAELFKEQYPEVYEIVTKDMYVDDCMSGEQSAPSVMQRMDEMEIVLNNGGFTFKGCTMSGRPPEKELSKDGVTIGVAGHKWDPEGDWIHFNIKDMNFAKKQRGRRTKVEREVPEKLTRRICSAKVGEVFDFSGLLGPITATFMLDLHQLVVNKLDWDDSIPENLRPIWESNFQLMGELKDIKYKRAVVPQDAVDLNITTLEFGDASRVLVCAAIYVRFLRKCGSYSCQLILCKTRLVPEEMTQPRAELYACVVNTHIGETVRRALSKHITDTVKFTDSQIAMFWFSKDDKVLKQWIRNRCIEIRRFTDVADWRYVQSEDMIADIGTRPCRSIKEVDGDSLWYNGYEWMKQDKSQFPAFTMEEVQLTNKEKQEAAKETIFFTNTDEGDQVKKFTEIVEKRYEFARYLIDPNRYRFEKVVRVLSMVIKFIRLVPERAELRRNGGDWLKPTELTDETLKEISLLVKRDQLRRNGSYPKAIDCTVTVFVLDEDVKRAEAYFHRKATEEVRKFLKPTQYKDISTESKGVLHFTGRILPEDEVTVLGRVTDVMKDLRSTTFCVPITEKHSPVAFSLVNDIHWNDESVMHSGVETTLRYVLKKMYVIDGRSLVKMIKNSCQRCRYLNKKALAVLMGPISKHMLVIAPAYYVCQLDLAGPFLAYSSHNKRTTIKVWLLVICCTTTSATNIKTMESSTTGVFLQAFTRFACEVGYPKRVLADGGSQLVKGCETMELNFRDIQQRLFRKVKVELEVCPVGGHNMHGRVERRIKEVKKSLATTMSNERLGLLQWETVSAAIANSINNLPLALGNVKGGYEMMDIITPNRLLLGRNNDRSPDLPLTVSQDYDKILSENEKIHQAWFEAWLISHVPKLVEQPKWFRSDRDIKKGDIVLFLKQESVLCNTYQYGMVESVEPGRDGKVRKVHIKYRNSNEETDRRTYRSTRSLIMIHPVDELNVMEELGQVSTMVDAKLRKDIAEKHKSQ